MGSKANWLVEDERFGEIWRRVKGRTTLSLRQAHAVYRATLQAFEARVVGGFAVVTDGDLGAAMVIALSARGKAPFSVSRLTVFGATDTSATRATLEDIGYPARLLRVEADVRAIDRVETNEIAVLYVGADANFALPALFPRVSAGGIILETATDESGPSALETLRAETKEGENTPFVFRVDASCRMSEKHAPASRVTIDRYDYHPPGFADPKLARFFPHMTEADPTFRPWRYLRYRVPHLWRVDSRNPSRARIGMLSVEEALLLHNLALPFRGERGLEIGAHHGWSSAHILAAGVNLDIVDPVFGDDAHRSEVETALDAVAPRTSKRLWAGFSPSILNAVAAQADQRWSFVFIDGNHDGDAPAADAAAVADLAADRAMIVFHDLSSPDVARGLSVLKDRGWNTRVFFTMQIMGAAWRGDVSLPDHIADPNIIIEPQTHLKELMYQSAS